MMFVLKHKDLPVPLPLSQEAHQFIKESISRGENVVVLGDYILNAAMMSVIPQEQFLKSDSDELSKKEKYRCKWGVIHTKEGKRDCRDIGCALAAEKNSPFILTKTWEIKDQDILEAQAYQSGDLSILKTSVEKLEERFIAGEHVLRDLVRIHRKDHNLISDTMNKTLERFSATPLSNVPDLTHADLLSSREAV